MFKKLISLFLPMIVFFSSFVQANSNDWLITILSGNARVDVWLQSINDPQQTFVLHEIADNKIDPKFLDRYGNIAVSNFATAENNANYLTEQLLKQIFPKIKQLIETEELGSIPQFSVLYAVAGLDAVDGFAGLQFSPDIGRQALHSYERSIDETAAQFGIQIQRIVGVSDVALLLAAIQENHTGNNQIIIYDDVHAIGFKLANNADIYKKDIHNNGIPAGGYFQLGYNGSTMLTGEDAQAKQFNQQIRDFWQNRGITYSAEDISNRYQKRHRNELGGVMSELIKEDDSDINMLQAPLETTVTAVAELSKNMQQVKSTAGKYNELAGLISKLLTNTSQKNNKLQSQLEKTATALTELAQEAQHLHDQKHKTIIKIIGFYGETLENIPNVTQTFNAIAGEKISVEILPQETLKQNLSQAALNLFQQVLLTRYGYNPFH